MLQSARFSVYARSQKKYIDQKNFILK